MRENDLYLLVVSLTFLFVLVVPFSFQVQLPADFPQELLYTGGGDEAEEEYWAQEDERK